MIKLNNQDLSMDDLEKILKKKLWLGEPVSNVHLREEKINFQTHPYTFLLALSTQLRNEGGSIPPFSFSWKVKVFLLNKIYYIRNLFRNSHE